MNRSQNAQRQEKSVEETGLNRLGGKSAVVTGAAKGIGRATAELFAQEGARLVVNDVDEAGLKDLEGRLSGEDRREGRAG